MQPELLKILVDILRTEMQLEADQVVIYNQQWTVPNDQRLYLSLNVLGSKPYANNRRYRPGIALDGSNTAVLNQEQSINLQDMVSLHVMSYGSQARLRRNEALFTINSDYAEQQMEANSFQIGRVPVSFVDASEALGTEILYRYVITFNVLYAQATTAPVEYYDKFPIGTPAIQP